MYNNAESGQPCLILHITLTKSQWRNDGVAAASRDGRPPLVRGPPTVSEFLIINFNVYVCC